MNHSELLAKLISIGLPINHFGHLLSLKVVIIAPESVTHVMAVSGARLNYQGNLATLYMATGETLTLVPIKGGVDVRWEFRIPLQFHPTEIMQISYYCI